MMMRVKAIISMKVAHNLSITRTTSCFIKRSFQVERVEVLHDLDSATFLKVRFIYGFHNGSTILLTSPT